ncbi:MAG: sodium:panthothenate symporter [Lentisphaeria bacterium]
MHWIDWVIVALPILIVFFIGWKSQRYVTGVADFLTAGRVAGRYVVSVASGEAGMGLVSLVAIFEMYYNSGFAFQFWNGISAPIGLFLGLTGYCIYRFRETRAMTMGQFFEMRYSRKFRIFAAILQSISGVVNYAIFPAVSARFIIYYCNLPLHFDFLGMTWATFHVVMLLFLGLAVMIVTRGGQITVMVCDCVQGLLNYPLMAVVVIAILFRFSWFEEMAPTLLDREIGKSMLNPFDVNKLRTFNLFYVMVGIISNVFNRMAWSGTQGYNTAALNAHEQKMGQVLGTWRSAFNIMLYPLLAIAAYTLWHNANFESQRTVVRQELAQTAIEELAPAYAGLVTVNDQGKNPETLEKLRKNSPKQAALLEQLSNGTINHPAPALATTGSNIDDLHALRRKNLVSWDTHALNPEQVEKRVELLKSEDPALHKKTMTIHNQMRVPLTLRFMLPIGVTGVLCAIAIFLMISTDTTYLHSWGSIIVQDVILPIRGKPLTPRQQLLLLRLSITGVAFFAFVFSSIFAQVDYIMMFFAITGAIWLGGAGSCIVFGLYWKRGTVAGAWASLIAGSSIATSGFAVQYSWVKYIYPWLQRHDLLDGVASFFAHASAPFEPFIVWRVTATSFPINSQEIYFLALVTSIILYVTISLLTCKQPFNMDRMLHRGIYHREGVALKKTKWSWSKMLGINENYTRGDRILAWSVFLWSFVFRFCIVFVGFIIWNLISPWPKHWWANWFWIDYIYVMGLNATVTIFWFGICGTRDLIRMFRRLDARTENASVLDDGRVEGHISADDVALVAKVEDKTISETDDL